MKALITGGTGQLGHSLRKTMPNGTELVAPMRSELDMADEASIRAFLANVEVDVIINTAAYTAVDAAESDVALANEINGSSVGLFAEYCQKRSIPYVQISTDFVFDGNQGKPYSPFDKPNPLGVYGSSKLLGEQNALKNCSGCYVIRAGWLYCEHGANFVKTMLKLAANVDQLKVVADQVGTPTYTGNFAKMIWALLQQKPEYGIYHFSDAGMASWYDLCVASIEIANDLKLISACPTIIPITTNDYPTAAMRPSYSVLDKTQTWEALALSVEHWRSALHKMLFELAKQY